MNLSYRPFYHFLSRANYRSFFIILLITCTPLQLFAQEETAGTFEVLIIDSLDFSTSETKYYFTPDGTSERLEVISVNEAIMTGDRGSVVTNRDGTARLLSIDRTESDRTSPLDAAVPTSWKTAVFLVDFI